jgi:hypothetical protein
MAYLLTFFLPWLSIFPYLSWKRPHLRFWTSLSSFLGTGRRER